MKSSTTISVIIAILIIAGAVFFSSQKTADNIVVQNNQNSTTTVSTTTKVNSTSNVSIINGVQIIELTAKGGYSPQKSVAKAGLPTVIRFETNNTYDCSLSIRIPSLNLSQFLTQTGTTDINIGTQPVGLFRGSCGMGMYPFEVYFR